MVRPQKESRLCHPPGDLPWWRHSQAAPILSVPSPVVIVTPSPPASLSITSFLSPNTGPGEGPLGTEDGLRVNTGDFRLRDDLHFVGREEEAGRYLLWGLLL